MQLFTIHLKRVIKVVRRSDRLWAGLTEKYNVEQVLMGSLKISGDLTSWRGMTEHQHITWLLSMPACVEVNSAMQELIWVDYNTDKQYNNIIDARRVCDIKDTNLVFNHLLQK